MACNFEIDFMVNNSFENIYKYSKKFEFIISLNTNIKFNFVFKFTNSFKMNSPRSIEFIPSSVRAMSLKVSKSFAQHVNLKIEPTLYSDWCKKPDSKKKSESSQIRFCVITPAALYVCKLRHISTIKISQVFPWISIKSFKSNLDNCEVTLEFAEESIHLIFTNVLQFVTKAVSYLKSILPPYFPIEYDIRPGLETEIEPAKPKLSQIIDLFISKCKVFKENVDPNLISNLKHNIKSKKTFNNNKLIIF